MSVENETIYVKNFVDGEYVAAESGEWLDNVEPATGLVFSKVCSSDASDVQKAYLAASAAFPSWRKTTTEERSKYLYRIADILSSRLVEFAEAESQDNGKPVSLATSLDIPRAVHNFRFFAGAILHHEEMSTQMDEMAVCYTTRHPIGVVGLISPWNLPLYLLTWKIAPAIACGNTVVCKPSELTPRTASMLCQVLNDAGLPKGVVNIVHGLGPKCGNAIVSHPSIKMISFTGGTKTAQAVIINSAPYYKKLSLELGGKNPVLIFDDCNLEACVATTVRSSFLNQGEICLCGSRIYVQAGIYDQFMAKFLEKVKALKVGDPKEGDTNCGALVSRDHMNKVRYYIQKALDDGGKIEVGGLDAPEGLNERTKLGFFVRPTVVSGLTHQSCVIKEEIFGPVVSVIKFGTETSHSESQLLDEAISLANDVQYGLACTLWTSKSSRVHKLAHAIDAGTVWVNTWMLRDLRVPFGGMKASGIGREGGTHSIDTYTEQKTTVIRHDLD